MLKMHSLSPRPSCASGSSRLADDFQRWRIVCRHFDRHRGGAERYAVRLAHAASEARIPVGLIGQSATVDLQQRFPFQAVRPPRWTLASKTPLFAQRVLETLDTNGRPTNTFAVTRVPHARIARVTDRVYQHWLQVNGSSQSAGSRWQEDDRPEGLQFWSDRFSLLRFCHGLSPRHRALLELEQEFFSSDRTEGFVVQSHYERELIQRYYSVPAEKLHVIYNGVSSFHYRPVPPNRRHVLRRDLGYQAHQSVVLFAAAQHYDHKGLASLLDALCKLDKHVRLLVVGGDRPGPWLRRIQRMDPTLRARVRFLPKQKDLRSFYWLADLFALPTRYEPCPNVALEALACGIPVLTSSACGIAELIRDTPQAGYVVEPDDAPAIAESIKQFQAKSAEQREEASFEARQKAESLNWERHFEQLWSLLRSPVAPRAVA